MADVSSADTAAPAAPPPSFDIAGARAAGASDAQIASYLAPMQGFDLVGALRAGASTGQVAEFLAARPIAPQAPPEESSAGGAFVRAAGEQALPATGGMAAAGMGAETGAALGAMIPGAGETGIPEVVGALGGGLLGYFAGSSAVEGVQRAAINMLPESVQRAIGQAPEQRQADVTQHPYASMAGGLAPNLLFLRPSAVAQAADEGAPAIAKFMAGPITSRVFGAGVSTAFEAGQEAENGQGYDPAKLAIAATAGALMNRETALGRAVSGAGAVPVSALLRARTSETPAAASDLNAGVADILQAGNVDDSIAAAQDLVERQTPANVGQVATDLEATGEAGDQQQAKLLRMFGSIGGGAVEHDGIGGYQFRTTDAAGDEVTHPIEVWNPDEPAAESAAPTMPPETAQAIRDHYAAAGVDTVFYRDDPAMRFDGATDPKQPDTMFVSNNPVRAAAQVAGHEFTHVLADTTLPDGSSLGDLLNRQIAAGITPEGQRYAEDLFGPTAPQRTQFPAGPDGDAAHAAAVQAHLVNELGADIGAEAPKFQTFLPRVVDAIQARFGNTVAGDVLGKLISGLHSALDTVRGFFGDTPTVSHNWVTNIGDIHDTLARMYAERFGAPAVREQAALLGQTEAAILRPVGGNAEALAPDEAARLATVRERLDDVTGAYVPPEPPPVNPRATPFQTVPREPQRLADFLRRPTVMNAGTIHETIIPGGLKDPGGDVRAIMGGVRGRPGLLNDASGRSLDDATQAAWEAGYFPEHSDRPSTNDLLDKLSDDLRGNPQYSDLDHEQVAERATVQGQNAEIDRYASELGIEPRGLTRDQFFEEVGNRLSVEEVARDAASQADAHEASYAAAEKAAKEDGYEPEHLYGDGRARTLEDLENEYRQEEAAPTEGQRDGGGAELGAPTEREGPVPAGGEPRGVGAGATGRGPEEGAVAAAAGTDNGVTLSPRRPPLPPPQAGPDLLGRETPEPQPRVEPEPTIRNDARQTDMFGRNDAAVQAQAARDQAVRGGINPRGEVKPADEGLFKPREPPGGTLFSPRPGEEEIQSNARDETHADDVTRLIDAVHAERGETQAGAAVDERDLSRIAQLGIKAEKNVNWLEGWQTLFPRTFASLNDRFARYYERFMAREREGKVNQQALRTVIDGSLNKLPAASRDRVYAAAELARRFNARPQDNGNLIRVKNTSYWQAQHSKVGDDYVLTAQETRAFHDTLKLGDAGWKMFMSAMARREGWRGDVTPEAIEAGAREAGQALPEGKRLMRLANALREMQGPMSRPYFPATRFGDVFIAVRPKIGPELDTASVASGRPKVQWFQTVERGMTRDLMGLKKVPPDQMQEVQDAISQLGKRPDVSGNPAFGEFKNTAPGRWESATHEIETGNLRDTPGALRGLNIPAVEKLFMLMERNVTPKVIAEMMAERTPEEGLSVKEAADMKRGIARYGPGFKLTGGEAFDRYQGLLGATKDTLLDQMYYALQAGWKKQANLTPGYSADFDRAIGTHIGSVSRNTADMVHRDDIDRAYQDIQDGDAPGPVKNYALHFQRYQDDPQTPGARAAQTANQVGFAWALAANPASTLKILLHTTMMGAPVMSVGVGMPRAAVELLRASGDAYRHVTFDLTRGANIDVANAGRTPAEQLFLDGLAQAGLLRSVGAQDIAGLNDRQSGLWGSAAPLMRRVMDVASSNIGVVDQANRVTIALAAYRIAQDPAALAAATKPLMEHNALFRATVEQAVEGKMHPMDAQPEMATAQADALREVYPAFMLDQAGGQWGRSNQAPAMRGIEGSLLFSMHGFQTRYLSTMFNLLKNTGPEGRLAAAWMIGGLAAGAGAYGLPFVQDLEAGGDWAWKAITHEDPMIDRHIREWMADAGFGKVGSEVLLRGPAAALSGVDTPSAIGFGDIISREVTSATNAFGTVPSILMSSLMSAYARESSGQGASAAAALLPSALRNPVEASIQSQQGVISARGEMTMPAEKFSTGDAVTRAIGLPPLSVAQARARGESDFRLGERDQELRQDIERSFAVLNMRAAIADRSGDRAGADDLRAQAQQMVQANRGLMLTEQGIKDAEIQMQNPEAARLMRAPMRVRAQIQNSPYP